MTARARRIQRLRRRVAVGAVATFTAAFGTVAATGSTGATTTPTTTTDSTVEADSGVSTQVAEAPSTVTTRQS